MKKAICIALTGIVISAAVLYFRMHISFDLLKNLTGDVSFNADCVIINDENTLKKYSFSEQLQNIDFIDSSYIVTFRHELKDVRRISPFSHFVKVKLSSKKEEDQLYIYEVRKKIYFNERRGSNVKFTK